MSENAKTKQDNETTVTEIVLDGREMNFSEASKRARDFTAAHESSYLQDPKCQTQRSQLLIACVENLSDDFIQTVFDGPELTSVTIDFLHFIALLVNEDFVRRFYGKKSNISEVNDALLQHFATNRFPGEVELREKLTKEVDEVRKSYETEIEFLKKERKSMKKWIKESDKKQAEIDAARKKSSESEVKLAVADKDKEIQRLTMELETCQKDLDRALKERDEVQKSKDEALKDLEDARKAAIENKQKGEPMDEVNSYHGSSNRCSRKDLRRAKVLVNAISDKKHSKEQFDVIADAYKKGLSYRGLVKLAETQIPAGNLEILENLLLRDEFGIRMRGD